MNKFFATRPSLRGFDAGAVNATIARALADAGIDTRSGPMRTVTETIRNALGAVGSAAADWPAADDDIIDVPARVVAGQPDAPADASDRRACAAGSFSTQHFSNHAGARPYRLYIPAGEREGPRPLLVMLHGCTQTAEDFAAGTRMNALADQHGFIVVYPEQTAQANPSRCWNWFNRNDQHRDRGEPALLAGLVLEVAARHGVDRKAIYVAGLSAGAAMAVILGETHPDLFAAIGAHSGLPYGSAHDIASAMAAMKGGRSGMPALQPDADGAAAPARRATQAVPTIVFHGDRDHTVRHSNGSQIIVQAEHAHRTRPQRPALSASREQAAAANGRRHTRTVHRDADGRVLIEHWTLHGAGHAWSGGSSNGSHTDPHGPDASAEMLRFFLAQRPAVSAEDEGPA